MGNHQLLKINTGPLGSWLRRLVAGFPQQSPAFHRKSVRVRLITDKVQWVRFISENFGTFILVSFHYCFIYIFHSSTIKTTQSKNASVIQKSLPPNNETASLVSKHYSYSVMKHILMKSFHYSRWHSNLYLFIFFCASQTNRQRQAVCCGTPLTILKTKQITGHIWGSQGGMKIAVIWNVRSRGLVKSYWSFGRNVLPPWR